MKLECKIKRNGGSIIDMPNDGGEPTRYHFKPLDPTQPRSPHVAEVQAKHTKMFFKADAEVYQVFDPSEAPALEPPSGETSAAAAAVTTNSTADDAGTADAGASASDDAGEGEDSAAPHVTSLTIKALRAGIGSKTFSQEYLRELLEQEQQAERPRPAVIAEITKALT